jgi:Zn-dependent peptidase ImmA (M78 family)
VVRRGFGAFAERLAADVREELGLEHDDRLDPLALANQYGVPVVSILDLTAHGASPHSIRQVTAVDSGCFSAATVFAGLSRLIVFNPAHSDRRLANSLTHELSHLLLEHTPSAALGPGGCRVWDKDIEDEADTLAGVLLVPRDAALDCARVGLPHVVGAARFGVSAELMQWRTDHSGASKQARAGAQRSGRTLRVLSRAQLRCLPDAAAMEWLGELPAESWRRVVRRCGQAIGSDALDDLCAVLKGTVPVG